MRTKINHALHKEDLQRTKERFLYEARRPSKGEVRAGIIISGICLAIIIGLPIYMILQEGAA